MKKSLIALIMMVLVAGLMPMMLPVSAEAQQKAYARRVVGKNGRVYYVRTKKPSFYRRHRNRVNMAIGTGAGALLGGLIGGKKGALIGGATGLGGSALYTYKVRPKKKKYVRVKRY
ncbi:MAG TPA: YMGG-like glycine zipper-containing protein [Pyrinomonadaceae bacterium]